MSVFIFLLVVILFCVLFIWTKILLPQKHSLLQHQELNAASERKLSNEELASCQRYLKQFAPGKSHSLTSLLRRLKLTHSPDMLRNQSVYTINHTITRYGLSTSVPELNRYYLDAIEVHLPVSGIPHIATENHIQLVYTYHLPLVIALNGHYLLDDSQISVTQAEPPTASDTSIRKEKRDNVKILNVRKQTTEEYTLAHINGINEALILCCALLLVFCSLLTPLRLMPWILLISALIILPCLWVLYRRPPRSHLQEIRTMRGVLKPWGLFGEANPKQQSLSLGVIDLHYPEHWQPYIQSDIGHETTIEIDGQNRVVSHGEFLSLSREVVKFPLQKWRHNLTLAIGALLILIMTTSWIPASMPFKISLAWLQGMQRVNINDIQQLAQQKLQVGALINIQGKGRCIVPQTYQSNRSYDFLPFDCSSIYWNKSLSTTLPSSKVMERTNALLTTTNQQLNAEASDLNGVNPQLAAAIQRSGMILLTNFSDIVLKTAQLCQTNSDCQRLKSALVNLENANDWPTLVNQARSGKLKGINVLLRPNSAQNLTNLVDAATTSFISKETRKTVEALSHLPAGGYLFVSGQGKMLVDQEQPDTALFDLEPAKQWKELQRISSLLLNTPFSLTGIITSLHRDSQGTTHVIVHSEPTNIALWRYLITALFLICLVILIVTNTLLSIHRLRADFSRLSQIQQDYDEHLRSTSTLLSPLNHK